jgi:hypothetical protein
LGRAALKICSDADGFDLVAVDDIQHWLGRLAADLAGRRQARGVDFA